MKNATLYCQWCSRSEYEQSDCDGLGDCGPWVTLDAMRERNPKAHQMIVDRFKLREVLGEALSDVLSKNQEGAP